MSYSNNHAQRRAICTSAWVIDVKDTKFKANNKQCVETLKQGINKEKLMLAKCTLTTATLGRGIATNSNVERNYYMENTLNNCVKKTSTVHEIHLIS